MGHEVKCQTGDSKMSNENKEDQPLNFSSPKMNSGKISYFRASFILRCMIKA